MKLLVLEADHKKIGFKPKNSIFGPQKGHFGQSGPRNGTPSGQTATYQQTKGIQSSLRIWRSCHPIESGPSEPKKCTVVHKLLVHVDVYLVVPGELKELKDINNWMRKFNWPPQKKTELLNAKVVIHQSWLLALQTIQNIDIWVCGKFSKASPLFGHCPNSNYTPPPRTQTGTLGHFFSGPIWANLPNHRFNGT